MDIFFDQAFFSPENLEQSFDSSASGTSLLIKQQSQKREGE